MCFEQIEAAEGRWRRVNAPELVVEEMNERWRGAPELAKSAT